MRDFGESARTRRRVGEINRGGKAKGIVGKKSRTGEVVIGRKSLGISIQVVGCCRCFSYCHVGVDKLELISENKRFDTRPREINANTNETIVCKTIRT